MDVESLRLHCIQKKGVTEGFPFGPDPLVFKVMGKMFAICPLELADRVNLKCDPEYALELRDRYPETVLPGYHMNKRTWNTVMIQQELSDPQIRELIDHSYELIVNSLPKKVQKELAEL
ncbi:MAG: MmcQ/YjbR family DNA-binding protein [Bacteroidota bacterium]